MRELLAIVTARLVRHELYVARFYLQRDNYDAAVLRIQYALRNFATGTDVGAPVGESAGARSAAPARTDVPEDAQVGRRARRLRDDPGRFSDSGLIVSARGYLDWMHDRGV